MTLGLKPIEEITEDDLVGLVEAAVPERQDIDYKLETYGNTDGDKREFLADISSFANTAGGDIIIGMGEDGGIPMSVPGIDLDIDNEKLRLDESDAISLDTELA